MFFNQLASFAQNIALIDCSTEEQLTYSELNIQCIQLAKNITSKKELVFIEAKNNIPSVVAYLACLQSNKVVYLLEDLQEKKALLLIQLYKPAIIIDKEGSITRTGHESCNLHPDLSLLLSTSGSTGTPKFVKLSAKNIDSNANAIAEYLKLTECDIAMSHLKLHYSYGISVLNSHLAVGATTALTNHGVLDKCFWLDVDRFKATSFAGVPYTYESLEKSGFDFGKHPSLRYVTQAGGKLESNLVQKYVESANKCNVDFYVMYGQTEASPRISYLPPELAIKHPSSIGVAIPGGTLTLVDDMGNQINDVDVAGELAYQGDNVMMGYAEKPEDLAFDNTPDVLLTGDIACINADNLFYIVGRTKRFVKLFGLRINLDDVQSFVKEHYPQSAVTGDDNGIIIVIEKSEDINKEKLIQLAINKYSLPKDKFSVVVFDSLPLLISGKYDYKTMAQGANLDNSSFLSKAINKIINILGLNTEEWESIHDLFVSILNNNQLEDNVTFNDLDTDSLSFVQLSVELEHCLGEDFPENWQEYTILSLDNLYQKSKSV